jgi:hypothetical protein
LPQSVLLRWQDLVHCLSDLVVTVEQRSVLIDTYGPAFVAPDADAGGRGVIDRDRPVGPAGSGGATWPRKR